jgi:hypothetical protein
MPPGFSSFMTILSGVGVLFNLLFVLYPIAVLVVMLLPSTAAAFRGEATVREEREDSPDTGEYFEEPGHQPPRSDRFRQ